MISGVLSLLSLALFFFLPQSVIAQAYPKQAINLIIPLAPGDSTDVAGRTTGPVNGHDRHFEELGYPSPMPFKGAGPAVAAALGGHIEGAAAAQGVVAEHLKAGTMRGIF
ncbi:MAG: hypothetical protein E6J74_26510 [Deltaproteobacteria bacterium]|nr:MAG: hypothetical protein E6J74_26510 [Deltaproteobacteria bacterium]